MIRALPFAILISLLASPPLLAHCDTLEGPVIADARAAFEANDVTPVLKWVNANHEQAIRSAFARASAARKSAAAREVADTWFFETLVRLHREGEGAPYTGITSVTSFPPAIADAEKAIASGSLEQTGEAIDAGIHRQLESRFGRLMEAKAHAKDSVEAGRAYVAAYVDFMHYVEKLYALGAGGGDQHGAASPHAH